MKTNSIFLFALALTVMSCHSSETIERLRSIEGYIQDDPARALSELSAIDKSYIDEKEDRALYSLLYSMALDKNYIDIRSDSLIVDAVNYYSVHGSRRHRFLSYYYLARVQTNAELYPEAAKSCLRAESLIGKGGATDDYRARLYAQMAEIYLKQFALDKAVESSKKARAISEHLDNPQFYIHNSLDLASLMAARGMSEEACSIADSLETWIEEKGLDCPPAFYETALRLEVDRKPVDMARIRNLYDGYKESVADDGLTENPVTVCRVESVLGNYVKARDAIGAALINADDSFAAAGLYSTLSRLHEGLGEYETALEYRYKYDNIVEGLHKACSITMSAFSRNAMKLNADRTDRISYVMFSLVA
ncbi:MAG: hypothetical protein J6Y45_04395 [Bacteroidales bacterium]|nr:hypothetical protein [Bacteroidales bacterium]